MIDSRRARATKPVQIGLRGVRLVEHPRTPAPMVGRVFPWLQVDFRGGWLRMFEDDGRVAARVWIPERDRRVPRLILERARKHALAAGRYDITVQRTTTERKIGVVFFVAILVLLVTLMCVSAPGWWRSVTSISKSAAPWIDAAWLAMIGIGLSLVAAAYVFVIRTFARENVRRLRIMDDRFEATLFDGRNVAGPKSALRSIWPRHWYAGVDEHGTRVSGDSERAAFAIGQRSDAERRESGRRAVSRGIVTLVIGCQILGLIMAFLAAKRLYAALGSPAQTYVIAAIVVPAVIGGAMLAVEYAERFASRDGGRAARRRAFRAWRYAAT